MALHTSGTHPVNPNPQKCAEKAPKWSENGPKMPPKQRKTGRTCTKSGPKMDENGVKMLQNTSKTCSAMVK